MAEIKTIYKGESVTLLFTFPEAYDMARLASHKVFVGETEFAGVVEGQAIKMQLKSSDTDHMIGMHKVVLWIDDAVLGLRKPYCGDLVVAKTQASGSNASVSNISDIIIPIVISETAITVGDILYNYVKGDPFLYSDFTPEQIEALKVKGDPFEFSDFTPEQIAELQKPASDIATTVSNAEGLRVTAETNRNNAEGLRLSAEIIRNDNEADRIEAEELRAGAETGRQTAEGLRVTAEQARQTNTATAIQNAETATNDANDAAGLANNAATLANTKAGLADTATTQANAARDGANSAAQSATNLVNSYATDLAAKVAKTDIEQTRSQATNKVASSKLLDDELKKITKDVYNLILRTNQGVPYSTGITTSIFVPAFLIASFEQVKIKLSNYVDFKFRFIGSDTASPSNISPSTNYYQADTILTTGTVLAKPYVWVQIVRVDAGALTPASVVVSQFLNLNERLIDLQTNVDAVKYDYINLIPDNAFQSGIDFFANQPLTGKNSVTLSKADFANPYSRYSLRAIGVSATASTNYVGIDYDISSILKSGDTIVFRGLIYPTYTGAVIERRIKNAAGTIIQTLLNLPIIANQWNEIEFEAILPTDAAKINLFVRPITQNESVYLAAWDIHKKPSGSILSKISVPIPSESQKTVYVNSSTGSDSGDGSALTPFATIGKALTLLTTIQDLSVVISGGDYRETIELSTFIKGRLSIHGKMNETVRILGSTKISGFAKTAGLTNVYEVAFSTTINAYKPVIFEDGRASLPILEEERHALQKSNTHRLPYSKLTAVAFNTDLATTLATLDATAGSYYRDTTGGKLYIHTSDSNDPTTNGYSYEYAVRGGITTPDLCSSSKLNLTNISFYFSNTYGIDARRFGGVNRQFVCVFGAANNGIEDASTFVVAHNDEVADTRDGLAGTHDITSNNRQRNNVTYIGAWSHDNTDDGASHHSKANVKTIGCLFEYNGKSGIAPSNSCQWTDINSICRKNGGNPAYPLYGEGVEVINSILSGDNGIGCTFTGYGTICEGNRVGFGTRISSTTSAYLYGCISRNNIDAEYLADAGKLYANNCKATNSDPLKLKVTTAGGTITVVNDSDLI